MAETILIIEDDPTLLRVLADNFKFEGYVVETAANGRRGLEAALRSKAALILLDIMLPEVDGFEICRRIRREGLTTPIIMLTAKGQESDIVRGLNLGADDYVTKPFNIHVLLARVQACLRRRQVQLPAIIQFGSCRLDTTTHRLFKGECEIILTPKEFRLLEFFVRNAGRALTRDAILDGVWGNEIMVTDRSVDRCVTTLRSKIQSPPEGTEFIHTIRDVGYRFEPGP